MMWGKFVDSGAHEGNPGFAIWGASAIKELVIDGIGDEGGREAAEVLLEGRGDGVDIKVGIGDVEVGGGFESFFDDEDLRIAPGFAVDAFGVHSCCNGQRQNR